MEAQWITFLLAVIPLWFLQNVVHEYSHGLTLKWGWGWKFKVWPFPSTKLGRFTFACTMWEKTADSKDPGDSGWALVYIMPRLVNLALIVMLTLPAAWISNKIISMIVLVFVWTNLIDFCVGLLTIMKKPGPSDIWKFKECLGIPLDYLRYSCIGFIIYQVVMVVMATLIKLL